MEIPADPAPGSIANPAARIQSRAPFRRVSSFSLSRVSFRVVQVLGISIKASRVSAVFISFCISTVSAENHLDIVLRATPLTSEHCFIERPAIMSSHTARCRSGFGRALSISEAFGP
jgi:hypothetical protein